VAGMFTIDPARPAPAWQCAMLAVLLPAVAAHAAVPYGPAARQSVIDPAVMRIDEPRHLGAPLDRDLPLVDSEGRAFRLGDMLGKPLILLFSYYGCDGACPTLNGSLVQALRDVGRFALGRDYHVLTVSFDRQDTPESARRFLAKVRAQVPPGTGWRHAVLQRPQTDIDVLTGATGYRYFWSRADQMFLHPNALVFVTPEGRVARYLYGTAVAGREVQLALIDADWGRISNGGAAFDMLTGVCYSYNFSEGRYTFNLSLLIGLASLLFGVSLIVFSLWFFRSRKTGRLSHA
jgi:protein SCO1